MENTCVIRRKDGHFDGQLVGPFDLPAEAVAYAMAVLGLDSSQFVLEVVCRPNDPLRPQLRLVGHDAA